MEKRIICIDNKGLYLEYFAIAYNFEVKIKITNKKEDAQEYILEEIPKILQILEALGFHKAFAIE